MLTFVMWNVLSTQSAMFCMSISVIVISERVMELLRGSGQYW